MEALRATFVSAIGTAQVVGWKPDEAGDAFLKLSKEVFAAKTQVCRQDSLLLTTR